MKRKLSQADIDKIVVAQANDDAAWGKPTRVNRMRAEYDFTGGVRGKHYHALQGGYTITIHKADGSTIVKEVKPRKGAVILEPDVRKYFPDSDSVNVALRSLIRLIPAQRKSVAKKHGA